ncbi:MAG: YHS domain-containing (seleno)protein [Myxococcota bacterium]
MRVLLAFAILVFFAVPALAKPAVFQPSDGVAIRGYDPVAYFTEGRPVKGSSEHSTKWSGATWHFSSAANLAKFKSAPERWAPQYGGWCAYAAAANRKAKTEPEAFTIVDGKLYLNYDLNIQKKWLADQAEFIRKADSNWPTLKGK